MSRAFDPSIYLVTDTAQCGGPDAVVEMVRLAVASGVTLVQLRDPDCGNDEFVELGRRLRGVLEGTGVPLIVNDRVNLVGAIGADGVHVGQGDLPIAEARRAIGPDRILGLSVSSPAHVEAARRVGAHVVDYLGCQSLRGTATKVEAGAIGLEGIAEVVADSTWPVVAIGGVKASDAADLRAIGCAGMAVVSAICGQADVGRATRALVDAWSAS